MRIIRSRNWKREAKKFFKGNFDDDEDCSDATNDYDNWTWHCNLNVSTIIVIIMSSNWTNDRLFSKLSPFNSIEWVINHVKTRHNFLSSPIEWHHHTQHKHRSCCTNGYLLLHSILFDLHSLENEVIKWRIFSHHQRQRCHEWKETKWNFIPSVAQFLQSHLIVYGTGCVCVVLISLISPLASHAFFLHSSHCITLYIVAWWIHWNEWKRRRMWRSLKKTKATIKPKHKIHRISVLISFLKSFHSSPSNSISYL